MNSKIKDKITDNLFEAMLTLKTVEECYAFFEDVCTVHEIKSLAQRLEVARMLEQKKTYIEIQNTTGASTATISRVNRCLEYGADGYKIVLERTNDSNEEETK
ncbi:MAG: YerC/YecD family TrpR-related protein [Cellulosilyticaceae bacterium]